MEKMGKERIEFENSVNTQNAETKKKATRKIIIEEMQEGEMAAFPVFLVTFY